jgi:cytochrome c553
MPRRYDLIYLVALGNSHIRKLQFRALSSRLIAVLGSNFGSTWTRRDTLCRFFSGAAKAAVTVALLAMTRAAAQEPATGDDIAAGQAIAIHGVAPGRATCAACHMSDGAGQPEVGIPRLAGLDFAYILDQLTFFAEGTRSNPAMQPFAKLLTPEQRRQVAAYFTGVPVHAQSAPTFHRERTLKTGKRLFLDGDFQTGLLACANCHGPGGQGVGSFAPRLAGQSAAYIEEELDAWKAGGQRDPHGAFMRAEASHLSDRDIAAVAAFLESLNDAKEAQR